jgi:hypothetical protein
MTQRISVWLPIIALATGIASAHAADDEVYYGSRAGMSLTTVSKMGIGTANAIIYVKHTPKNAKASCVEYEQDHSMACVKRVMASVKVRDRVTANCLKRTWTDVHGQKFAFLGPNKKSDETFADYIVKDLKTGEILDGSSASGYDVALTTFNLLCPGIAK